MLASLVPGLRELRAPLAAGYLWLVGLWIALEPHAPERSQASGLSKSLYGLTDQVSQVGLGAASAFVAYLLGALSLAFFSAPLRWPLRYDPSSNRDERLIAVTPWARAAVETITQRRRDAISAQLALTPIGFEQLVDSNVDRETIKRRRTMIRKPRPTRSVSTRMSSSTPAPATAAEEAAARVVRAVLREFDLIMTRLMATEKDLFSDADRHRAEVEFRIAIVPPLLALAVIVAVEVDNPAWAVTISATGLVVSAALFWDALTRQRDANDALVDALAIGAVKAPTLERLEDAATAASRADISAFAAAAVRAVEEAVAVAERSPFDSLPSARMALRNAVTSARSELTRAGSAITSDVLEHGSRATESLGQAEEIWDSALNGRSSEDWQAECRRLVTSASEDAAAFKLALRAMLSSAEAKVLTNNPEERSGASRQ